MKIVIEGAGQVGSHLAKMLSAEGSEVTVIDPDAGHIRALDSTADVTTILGDPSSLTCLRDAGCASADLFIAVNPGMTQGVNIVSALLAKKLGTSRVIARIDDEEFLSPENIVLFKEMGLDMMFFPEKIASDEISDMLRHSASTESMDFASGKLQMAVFKLDDDSPLLDMRVMDFTQEVSAHNPNAEFRIVAVSRDGRTIIPKYDTPFKYGDYLYIITCREGMPSLLKFLGKDQVKIKKVMILGASEIAQMVTESLVSANLDDIKIVESNPARCRELSARLPDFVNVVCGDARNTDFLLEEDILGYQAVLAVTGNDELNILACVAAKKLGVPRVIAQVENIEYIHLAEEMGVDTVINKKLITVANIFKFTLSDELRSVRYMSGTDAEILEYTAAPGSKITKAPLKDLVFPRNAIIGGVIRGGDGFIAVGDTHIEAYDRVAVFALPDAVKDIDKFFK